MRRLLEIVVILFVSFLGLAFAVLNAETVEIKYYLGTISLPLALILAIALLIGALLGGLASIGYVLHQRRENSRLRKKLSLVETELKNLREIPIKDVH
ncbi:MAG TPA: lipopolysaccharide assembly protein LapA domain-containing protein [Gammaproteobacteria bacterium]